MPADLKRHKCQFCEKSFKKSGDLKRHERIHTNTRPFACGMCGKSFIQKSGLTVHMRIHSGEKPYGCTDCGRAFSDASSLNRHRKLHELYGSVLPTKPSGRTHNVEYDESDTGSLIDYDAMDVDRLEGANALAAIANFDPYIARSSERGRSMSIATSATRADITPHRNNPTNHHTLYAPYMAQAPAMYSIDNPASARTPESKVGIQPSMPYTTTLENNCQLQTSQHAYYYYPASHSQHVHGDRCNADGPMGASAVLPTPSPESSIVQNATPCPDTSSEFASVTMPTSASLPTLSPSPSHVSPGSVSGHAWTSPSHHQEAPLHSAMQNVDTSAIYIRRMPSFSFGEYRTPSGTLPGGVYMDPPPSASSRPVNTRSLESLWTLSEACL
ncbi:hypothetical protein SeMB42_g00486 [Synchytrium endobioticum]|uniref:C2H2-type domain-containing protein n=1 Tax=Synchytrium endobioticum TaxID=286115 RepID=A0A507DR91_9FUNG|nr:hypothetical protein SeLEV6574_g00345 [Synchytrium endobioticum]TPX54046.1 hypothetical protein SeMB42_g00486 [Synchytrium endobioticum]